MKNNNDDNLEIRELKGKDRFWVDDFFLDNYARFVGIYVFSVYCALCRHADKKQACFPSVQILSDELKIGRSKTIEAIQKLEELRIIEKTRTGLRRNNRYRLLDKSHWLEINQGSSEVHDIDFQKSTEQTSDIHDIDFKEVHDIDFQKSTEKTSHSKELDCKELKSCKELNNKGNTEVMNLSVKNEFLTNEIKKLSTNEIKYFKGYLGMKLQVDRVEKILSNEKLLSESFDKIKRFAAGESLFDRHGLPIRDFAAWLATADKNMRHEIAE